MNIKILLLLITLVCGQEYAPPMGTFGQCERIQESSPCANVGWNQTYFPNFLNQYAIESAREMNSFNDLISSGFPTETKHFLCSLHYPICWSDATGTHTVKPCKHLCERVRQGCEKKIEKCKFLWPDSFSCEQFPISGPCFNGTGDTLETKSSTSDVKNASSCSNAFRVKHIEYEYQLDDDSNCAMPCNQTLFRNDEIDTIRRYVGILSILCLLSTLFTIMTYSIDLSRYRYPERPILFVSICYFIVACAYVGGFVDYFYGSNIVCDDAQSSFTGDNRFVVQGTHNKLCVLTFLLIYYFGMASMIWWVILTLTWFLAAGLKWGHEAIESQSVYFHFASWGIPACLSIFVISERSINGDYLAGVCYTGLTKISVQRICIIVPICMFLFVGLCFLLSGFVSVFKIRTVMKHEGTKTDKLERFMVRIGSFSVVYILPQLILIICLLYEQNNYSDWLRTWKKENEYCASGSGCYVPSGNASLPRYELFMIKYTCMLAIGIISSVWVLNGKTVASWKHFLSQQRRSVGSSELL